MSPLSYLTYEHCGGVVIGQKRVKLTAGEGEVWAGKGAVWAGRVEVWEGKGEVCAVDTCDVGDGSSHRMTSSQLTGTPNVGTWSGRR